MHASAEPKRCFIGVTHDDRGNTSDWMMAPNTCSTASSLERHAPHVRSKWVSLLEGRK